MKKIYPILLLTLLFATGKTFGQSGCAWSATTGLYSYGCGVGDEIDFFALNGTSVNDGGCSPNNYSFFPSYNWSLTIGNTYTWSALTGTVGYNQGMALWIDLNNDGTFTSNEQLGNSGYLNSPNHSGTFTIPFGSTPATNVRMRIRCSYYDDLDNSNSTACDNYNTSPNYFYYYGECEDYQVTLVAPTPCSSTPGANSVVSPTFPICPGSNAFVNLATTYTVGDIKYQWYSATSTSLGPYSAISSATNMNYTTPNLTTSTWYQVAIWCNNTSGTVTATPNVVMVQNTTTNTVPYFEGFENIPSNNKLPNCSWTSANIGNDAHTYVSAQANGASACTGNKFAAFYYSPAGTKNFYTNGIWMDAGVTYSASVWYKTEYYGYNNWTDLSILVGPNQSTTGQITVASTNGPAISNICKALTNTFTIPTSGFYYVNIRGTSTTSSYAYNLSWDDLSIIVPCSMNTPSVTLTASDWTVCAGQQVNINVTGANTYSWNTGSTSSSLVENPIVTTLYEVTATNSLAPSCPAKLSQLIQVNPTPPVGIFTDKTTVCAGQCLNLAAFGADSYTWSTGSYSTVVNVCPSTSQSYVLMGSNSFNCVGSYTQAITVNPSPVVHASTPNTTVCKGDLVQLNASGASTYQWVSPSNFLAGANVQVIANQSASYTLTGTDANGCAGTDALSLNVQDCVGLMELSGDAGILVYPNPNTGAFNVVTGSETSNIHVTDLTGRVVFDATVKTGLNRVDLSNLANGVYYVKVSTDNEVQVVRVVKQ